MGIQTSIQQAIRDLGGPTEAARRLDVKASTVSQWITGVRPVPADKCVAIEAATGISRLDLYSGDGKALWPEVAERAAA